MGLRSSGCRWWSLEAAGGTTAIVDLLRPWYMKKVTVLTVYIVTALCLKKGMNHFVLVVYQHVATTFAIAPFVLVLERSPTSPFPCILGSVRLGDT
ncbi:hypothetical protein Dimus_028806 [Dionaea muscipula]